MYTEYKHNDPSDLRKYLEGELKDHWEMSIHIDGCPLCQARMRDERLVRVLLGAGKGIDLGLHLNPDTMASYLDQKLDPEEMERIDRHLIQCDDCLQEILDAKTLLSTPPQYEPDPELLAKARDKLLNK